MNSTVEAAKALFEPARDAFGAVIPALKNIEFEDLSDPIKQYLYEHPYLTWFQIIMLLFGLIPGVAALPMLLAGGFGPVGPMAGKQAAIRTWEAPLAPLTSRRFPRSCMAGCSRDDVAVPCIPERCHGRMGHRLRQRRRERWRCSRQLVRRTLEASERHGTWRTLNYHISPEPPVAMP